ncbi:type I-U CRISPR-associated RAMP protein Csb1/Cas7u [Sphaerobacter sp.]|uniref:type I-G CRISPR-associated RAMP protein Csb1/Cas7g n=1 Tax=Sphaerobacter sp. TaxID=2099654 RepID=UPI001DB79233|nr:type I-U CRISPR-associated RAMP protein Csb1/Cas7u [Sphaerobacter sp.]MBX5446393.1 type I-U CRISPR-associated protein Cas7 [Sphaerobacter sp.]
MAALVVRQWLMPVEGKDAVIFPPTYPIAEDKAGYNIDYFEDDKTNVCQIDSVGSQANRMEPLFKREKYRHLVPQVVIRAGDRKIDLLDAGHRAADAIVRFSTLGPELHEAFLAYRDEGNAEPLARIAPTSIVFGSWDSRATQARLPRIVRSVIRAYNVRPLTRSAQYSTIAGEILDAGDVQTTTKGPKAELGLAHVPAVRTHGGVLVDGEIRREAIVNLTSLRSLAGRSEEETLTLRRYILGLALIGFTAPLEPCLREGCELVPDPAKNAKWEEVRYDGTRVGLSIGHDEALAYATAAAASFGARDPVEASFDADLAMQVLNLKEDDRKKLLRQGPVTAEALSQLQARGAAASRKGRNAKDVE